MSCKVLITSQAERDVDNFSCQWLYRILQVQLKSAIKEPTLSCGPLDTRTVGEYDLVIAFELSHTAKQNLQEHGVTFLDMRIHPIRFMDDIFFAFETNSEPIKERLERYRYDETLCTMQASFVTATTLKTKKSRIVPPNTLLLIGQTETDQVLRQGDRYLSLLDRIEAIKSIAADYDHLCFKPHPYAKNSRYIQRELRKVFGPVRRVNDNVYHLLSNDGVGHVAALNSSVLYEAAYFGKKTTFLYDRTFTDRQTGIYGEYLDGAFWSDILSPLVPTIPSTVKMPFQANRLRKALNDFWGYNEINDEIVLTDIVKSKIKRFLSRYVR